MQCTWMNVALAYMPCGLTLCEEELLPVSARRRLRVSRVRSSERDEGAISSSGTLRG